ncbi:MAG: hypothetical protein CVV39_01415 [Planctomycetes bacterium HGW-Planctomycetes-1]|nr:MAG: hypothetical protein CVV39_01415 [Planctomycetes bacterium HGW-Planctomycetes-1]
MNASNKTISVIEPVSEAIEKTKILLFKPFDLGKWFVIGFCAWLANLISEGTRGMANFQYGKTDAHASETFAKIIEFAGAHIVAVSIAIIAGAVLLVAFIVLLLWLSSRGQFMFLDCLAKNKAEIAKPWTVFKKQANSLFSFRVLLIVISGIMITGLSIPIAILAIAAKSANLNLAAGIAIIAVLVLLIIAVAMTFGLVKTLTFDFAAPIMYLQKISSFSAWRKFLHLLKGHFWKITFFLLFKLLIKICIGTIIFGMVLIGCCFCCISAILLIPYIGTVVLLPFISFIRFYSLCFLRQFGSEFDVFAAEA